MKSEILKNGIKVNYQQCEGGLTSFCIGFDAGANAEDINEIGVAHATEHMVFKGTSIMTEDEINHKCDELFAFNNAMTNYPYCIYYGVTSNDDFEESFKLYSDILINPSFSTGFKEEIGAIKAEYREWKDDMVQYCEDELYYNTFTTRRMKEMIIGDLEAIDKIDIEKIKGFYEKHYTSDNCIVSIVTSIPFEDVIDVCERCLCDMKKSSKDKKIDNYEFSNNNTYEKEVIGLKGAKLQYCFDISHMNDKEIESLRLFNIYLGEGVSSKLYDELRTKRGLVYDVSSMVMIERGIKMITISASSSKEDIDNVKNIIDSIINDITSLKLVINDEDVIKFKKIKKRKWYMDIEKKIVLAVRMTTYDVMFNNLKLLGPETEYNNSIDSEFIKVTAAKAFKRYSVQIIK